MARPEITLDNAVIRTFDMQPDLAAFSYQNRKRYPYLLQSVAHGTAIARFDILFSFPGDTLQLSTMTQHADFLADFDEIFSAQQCADESVTAALPFYGGWFVYLGYELAQQIEPTLKLPDFEGALPVAFATRCPAAIVFDHQKQQLLLVAEKKYCELLDVMEHDLLQLAPSLPELTLQINDISEDEPHNYTAGIARIKQYIIEGDVFQVNLSRAWRAQLPENQHAVPMALYQRLRRTNPAPFAALVHYENQSIISSSPERLVKVKKGVVEVRPIAGTRPRGEGARSDEAKREELISHPKERAEHIMLIDLERNDLGRIAEPGSVEVDELMILESYAHVHHIVSNIRGRLREGVTPGEVIRAVFPGGTITGCPKIRCMEIIAELEQTARGPYTGSLGYINRDGSMELNILIRTLHFDGDKITLRAGGGIVHDSEPVSELQESRSKARGLLLALENSA
ncbi:MAG: aminodeoxychorismate synthase component I [Gammaproteobacteria bacterium]|nr:aminodeoxychorismate synthase component I [Gammaproteobacteria bacterium]MCF6229790.1 aminodeoxychorismate synthase component I [Gammaproteobacteria bacterium]